MLTYSPATSTTSILVHAADLSVNRLGSGTPAQFAALSDTVAVGSVPDTAVRTHADWVPPDAGVVVGAGYDELVVDVQPVVKADGSVGSASAATLSALRQTAMTDRPFWLVVHTDGYGINLVSDAYAPTRALVARRLCGVVTQWLWSQCLALQITQRLRGFAYVCPDLNVQFTDGSVIDRPFQNSLVQTCWQLNRSCTIITSRPADTTCLIGPTLSGANANSGAALPHPILGCNQSQRDRVVVLYPNIQNSGHNPSVIAGMMAGLVGNRGRDPGFPLNLDVAFVLPLDVSQYQSDGVVGVRDAVSPDWVSRVCRLVAALGVTVLGTASDSRVLDAGSYVPDDTLVNTSGTFRWSSRNGVTTIRYPDATGMPVVRYFDAQFVEMG